MNNKGPFRNLPGSKNRPQAGAFISLHFNKADEDQLEINYGDASDSESQASIKEISTHSSISSNAFNKSDLKLENNDDISNIEKELNSSQIKDQELASSKDSLLKDYLSRISRRACSLDSEITPLDKRDENKESWPFFKDIKGKITKTLEERKSRDCFVKELIINDEQEILKNNNEMLDKDKLEEIKFDPDRTPTDQFENTDDSHVSPAIEASELVNEEMLFENFVENELDKAKFDIVPTKKSEKLPLQPHKSFSTKTQTSNEHDFSMTLSSLIANRCSSYEQVKEEIDNRKSIRAHNVDASNLINAFSPNKTIFVKHSLKKYYYFIKSSWNNVIFRIIVAVFSCIVAPISSWCSGFLIGVILAVSITYWLYKPAKPKEPYVQPNFNQKPPLTIPSSEIEDEAIIYKGWMNELPIEYNPDTYHVNCTRSIYIRLDGSYLRISHPKNNIPKRAMFNEPRHELQFIYQKHYDITGATIELLPKGLAKKRLWSKKYPICLKIPNPKQSVLSSSNKELFEENPSLKTTTKESPLKRFLPRINENNEIVLYLFSRTDREKDIWFNRFRNASKMKLLKSHSPSSSPNIAAIETSALENKRTISVDLASLQLCSDYNNLFLDNDEVDGFTDVNMSKQTKFEIYMSYLMSPLHFEYSHLNSPISKEKKDFTESKSLKSNSSSQISNLMWLNVLIGRIFFDFLTEEVWANAVAERIQRKLSKIKLPHFLEELTVKDINLGTALPKIHRASEPVIDQRGLWIDIDLSYNGSFQMTLETKLNLLKLHKNDSDDLSLSDFPRESDSLDRPLRSNLYNSEEEDSAESSSDEDITLPDMTDGSLIEESSTQIGSGSASKKILRFVDRVAQSTYFQHAAKHKIFKRAMEEVSNTPLVLTVEIHWLTGTLAINIPSMPTDRLWYGFRKNPHLSIMARPKLGQHAVTFTHVTEWIEKKLVSEFQKILVMPNMDDLIIPIMQEPELS